MEPLSVGRSYSLHEGHFVQIGNFAVLREEKSLFISTDLLSNNPARLLQNSSKGLLLFWPWLRCEVVVDVIRHNDRVTRCYGSHDWSAALRR